MRSIQSKIAVLLLSLTPLAFSTCSVFQANTAVTPNSGPFTTVGSSAACCTFACIQHSSAFAEYNPSSGSCTGWQSGSIISNPGTTTATCLTLSPSRAPTTLSPSRAPTTSSPSRAPTTSSPSRAPTTLSPSLAPTTLSPSLVPTVSPSLAPTTTPSFSPSSASPSSLSPTTLAPSSPLTSAPSVEPIPDDWELDYPKSLSVFQWAVFQVRNLSAKSLVWNFSNGFQAVDLVILTFPPYTFEPGNYTVNLTDIASPQTHVDSFQIVASPLVVIILGGGRDVASNKFVTLDASNSYDPDTNSTNALRFLWTPCSDVIPITNLTSPHLTIQTINPSRCTIRVAVSTVGGKIAEAVTDLQIINSNSSLPLPDVIITGPTLVNPSDTVRLLASISNLDSLTIFQWSSTPYLLTGCKFPQNSSSTARALVINAGACLRPGGVYEFTFTTGNGKFTTQAWINVTMAASLNGGYCGVSPLNGEALTTMFHVNCNGWSAAGPSLTYSLKQLASDGTFITLSGEQYLPSFDFVLDGNPPEPEGKGRPVQLFVVISSLEASIDQPLSSVTITAPLTCPSLSSSIQALTTIVSSVYFQQVCPSSNQRQVLWDALWSEVGAAVNDREFIDADSLTLLGTAISSLLQSIANSLVNMPTGFLGKLGNYLNSMYGIGVFTMNSTQAMLHALPAIIPIAPCETLQSGLLRLMAKAQELTKARLPGEDPIVLQAPTVDITAQNFFSDRSNSLKSDQISLNLPVSLLMQGGDISTVTVADYGSAFENCLREASSSTTVVGGITDVTLSNALSNVNVNHIAGGFSFSTAITGDVSCGVPRCAWWDQLSLSWNSDGCETFQAAGEVTCVCTHLTEFSLILRPGCVSAAYQAGYCTILALYIVVLLVIIGKVTHYWYYDRPRSRGQSEINTTMVLWQHFMLALLSISRIIACALLASHRQDWTLASRAVALLLPYMIQFWIWTLISFQWAAIYHFSDKSAPFRNVRWVFLISNMVIVSCIIATIITISDTSSATSKTVVITTGLITGVTLLTSLSFGIYSIALHRAINRGKIKTTHRLIGALVLSALFSLEAIMHLTSALLHQGMQAVVNGDASEMVVLVADLCCIVTLLLLYHRTLHPKSPREEKPDMSLTNTL